MKKTFLTLISTALMLFSGYAFADGDVTLPAKQVRPGCSVVIHKEYPPGVDPNVSSAVFDQQLLWKCDGAEAVMIGTIEAEGGGPEIVTVFYRANDVVVLARWASASAGADFQGDFYQVSAYRLEALGNKTTFKALPAITKAFGDGYDGLLDGKQVTFPYKNAASIRARLAALGL
ncbi:hypothetical protein Bsp3421_000074 (plasmid) [Burkholderia sp. FERM BP-3421]|uniref:hypothetical protein n=1 Tax=Burkholderia sp. FERM BP-3421 TaxID=1494466 RepID=UPI002360A360|nr:hypothetical protein [Burkholderia sp. FERM BP-3421]WDD90252.1 hypothetical protein Bsp3421_000074 [Burkholderia sp. FERM BP-3421]